MLKILWYQLRFNTHINETVKKKKTEWSEILILVASWLPSKYPGVKSSLYLWDEFYLVIFVIFEMNPTWPSMIFSWIVGFISYYFVEDLWSSGHQPVILYCVSSASGIRVVFICWFFFPLLFKYPDYKVVSYFPSYNVHHLSLLNISCHKCPQLPFHHPPACLSFLLHFCLHCC